MALDTSPENARNLKNEPAIRAALKAISLAIAQELTLRLLLEWFLAPIACKQKTVSLLSAAASTNFVV